MDSPFSCPLSWLLLFFFNINLFLWLHWVFIAATCGIFIASCRDLHLRLMDSLVVEWGLLVPQPGIEPVSPALQGRFSTPGPPGKSLALFEFVELVQT